MKDKKENEDFILEILNTEYNDDVYDSELVIKGITFFISNDNSDYYEEHETLYSENMRFTRTGVKVISYERWLYTNWTPWE